MIIQTLVVGMFGTNCHIVGCPETKAGAIIDPGGQPELILVEVKRLGLDVRYIINTHGHFDHTMGNRAVKEATGAPLAIHPADAPLLSEPLMGMSFLMIGKAPSSPPPDIELAEGDVIEFGTIRLKVLHTPGHSPGGISLLGEDVVFTGDTLFNLGIGRTDFPGGDYRTLIQSIKTKLFVLPDDMVAYTGHGPSTTIGYEKRANPFIP